MAFWPRGGPAEGFLRRIKKRQLSDDTAAEAQGNIEDGGVPLCIRRSAVPEAGLEGRGQTFDSSHTGRCGGWATRLRERGVRTGCAAVDRKRTVTTVEEKRRNLRMLAAACAAALLVVAVLVLLFLSGRSGRNHEQIVLPEARTEQEQPQPDQTQEEAVLSVTAENVQVVLQSMVRLTSYHQTFAVTRRSGTHTRTTVVDIWASDGRIRAELTDSFETRYLLTDGETVLVWYEGETPTGLSMQEGATYEDLAGLPTYEEILRLPADRIREGGFLADAQLDTGMIYVRAQTDSGELQYWVGADSGLLFRQTTTVDGTVVYEAEQTFLETLAAGDETLAERFLLPDGSDPFAD